MSHFSAVKLSLKIVQRNLGFMVVQLDILLHSLYRVVHVHVKGWRCNLISNDCVVQSRGHRLIATECTANHVEFVFFPICHVGHLGVLEYSICKTFIFLLLSSLQLSLCHYTSRVVSYCSPGTFSFATAISLPPFHSPSVWRGKKPSMQAVRTLPVGCCARLARAGA